VTKSSAQPLFFVNSGWRSVIPPQAVLLALPAYLFSITKDMAESIPLAPQSFDDIMVEAIDFFHIIKFS